MSGHRWSAEALQRHVADFVRDTDGADRTTALAAQFDAGLAWVQRPAGAGGLGIGPDRQAEVDAVLSAAGRLESWERNPMGIGMVAPALMAHGTPAQQALLRPIFTAEHIWCQLFSEPGAGSDIAGLATRAVRDGRDSAGWVVDGQKTWTSLAHAARFGLALTRTDPEAPKHAGLTAFLIDMRAPGVQVRPLRDLTGGTHFNEVFLDGVRLGDDARLGGIGEGWKVATTMLASERAAIGASVGERGSGAIALAVGTWRRTGSDPHRRAELTRLWVDAEVLRVAALRDQETRAEGGPGPGSSGLKLRRALLEQRIARFALELLGAAGLVYDADAVRADGPAPDDPVWTWLQSQAYTIAGGTSDVMRTIIGERLLGLPKEPGLPRDTSWSQIPR
ncbi:acyl-CoA dehydrogenase family protein [Dactylosporangium sp. NPDC005555]|uniref:acyl-CoA dehydrogenase family protein n=1 Tax=Dactylosporangium sp. NPDC005555 TaxID=3154889 RepID=UPI0033BCC155